MSRQLLFLSRANPCAACAHALCSQCSSSDKASSYLCAGDDSLIRISDDKLPGDSLALSMGKVWEVIKDQKDLNLPAHKVGWWAICMSPAARRCACQLPWKGCEWHQNLSGICIGSCTQCERCCMLTCISKPGPLAALLATTAAALLISL